jgi:hypothetical protein
LATRAYAHIKRPEDADGGGCRVIQWTGLLNGDDGQPFAVLPFSGSIIAVVSGTFGVGAVVNLEGNLDPVTPNWLVLPTAMQWTTAGGAVLKTVSDKPYQIRPKVASGDGTTSLTCTMVARA